MMRRFVVLVLALAGAIAGVVAGVVADAPGARAQTAPSPTAGPTSIVQLGDSVAAGEGTLYGYRWDPGSRKWVGGDLDATWPEPYPVCHHSPDAYGEHVASALGARFTQFACTGAQFDNGIATDEVYNGTTYRPPQFGDWAKQTGLNAEYDAARPDLVLVTLGADDVHFVKIVTSCVENALEHRFLRFVGLECTRANHGDAVKTDFYGNLPALHEHYATLVQWIAARAAARGVAAPKVVFTTYPDPLPPTGAQCPDSSWLRPSQLRYLSTLVGKLNGEIRRSVKALADPDVTVAATDRAYTQGGTRHGWCSKDPWAYGLSVFHELEPDTLHSQAPFHPSPRGQEAIAAIVTPTVKQLFGQ
jgi:lysophospholipase L1-like esterase